MAEQPFIPSLRGDVQAAQGTYIRRPADDQLFAACLNNEFAYVLACRQIGKSSLKNAVAERLIAEGIRVARIDLNRIGQSVTGAEQWYFSLLDEIARNLGLTNDVEEWWEQQAPLSTWAQRFVHFLDEIVLTEIKQSIVVFIDEIDMTLDLSFTNDLFAMIRSLHNDRAQNSAYRRLTFVLLGVASPDELIDDPKRTPFNVGKAISIRDFTLEECTPLLTYIEMNHPNKGSTYFDQIYHWTNGHPYLTQKLCHAIAQTEQTDKLQIIEQVVNKVFFKEGERKEDNLDFVQTRVLQDKYAGQMVQIYARILRRHTVLDDKKSPSINRLQLYGLVVVDHERLCVRNKIYEKAFNSAWCKENNPQKWTQLITSIAISVAALLIISASSMYLYNRNIDNIANETTANFYKTHSPKERIGLLAKLFTLKYFTFRYITINTRNFANEARDIFFNLPAKEQFELFQVSNDKIVVVIQGLYTTLADVNRTDRSTPLLRIMAKILGDLPSTEEKSKLIKEINSWLEGRTFFKQGQTQQALNAYKIAINLNNENLSTRYESARLYIESAQYTQGLDNLEYILLTLQQSGEPTSTESIATVVVTTTPTLTLDPTVIHIQTNTSTIATPSPQITPTSILPNTELSESVASEFSTNAQIIASVRKLLQANPKVISSIIPSNQQNYPYLLAYGLLQINHPLKENALGIWAAELQKIYNPTGNTSDNSAVMSKNDIPEGIACDVYGSGDTGLAIKKDETWQLVCSNDDFKTAVFIQVNGIAARGLTNGFYYARVKPFTIYGSGNWPDAVYNSSSTPLVTPTLKFAAMLTPVPLSLQVTMLEPAANEVSVGKNNNFRLHFHWTTNVAPPTGQGYQIVVRHEGWPQDKWIGLHTPITTTEFEADINLSGIKINQTGELESGRYSWNICAVQIEPYGLLDKTCNEPKRFFTYQRP